LVKKIILKFTVNVSVSFAKDPDRLISLYGYY
jgi:hypothetical protein